MKCIQVNHVYTIDNYKRNRDLQYNHMIHFRRSTCYTQATHDITHPHDTTLNLPRLREDG